MNKFKALLFSIILAFATLPVYAETMVDINTADAETISKNLKGIGIKKAEDIVAYRNKHGAFKSVNDLAKVKGIGIKTVESNMDKMMVGAMDGSTKGIIK